VDSAKSDRTIGHEKIKNKAIADSLIANDAIVDSLIKNGEVKKAKLSRDADDSSKIENGTIDLTDMGRNGADDNDVIKWSNAQLRWVPSPDQTQSATYWQDVRVLYMTGPMGLAQQNVLRGNGWSVNLASCTTGVFRTNSIFTTVSGGYGNLAAGDYAVVAGGGGGWPGGGPSGSNRAVGDWCVVSGGSGNQAGPDDYQVGQNPFSTVGGGKSNWAFGEFATESGGYGNRAWGNSLLSPVGTMNNGAGGEWCVVGGGSGNKAGNESDPEAYHHATIGGGEFNWAPGAYAAIRGG
jgi:hypothetical protein